MKPSTLWCGSSLSLTQTLSHTPTLSLSLSLSSILNRRKQSFSFLTNLVSETDRRIFKVDKNWFLKFFPRKGVLILLNSPPTQKGVCCCFNRFGRPIPSVRWYRIQRSIFSPFTRLCIKVDELFIELFSCTKRWRVIDRLWKKIIRLPSSSLTFVVRRSPRKASKYKSKLKKLGLTLKGKRKQIKTFPFQFVNFLFFSLQTF